MSGLVGRTKIGPKHISNHYQVLVVFTQFHGIYLLYYSRKRKYLPNAVWCKRARRRSGLAVSSLTSDPSQRPRRLLPTKAMFVCNGPAIRRFSSRQLTACSALMTSSQKTRERSSSSS